MKGLKIPAVAALLLLATGTRLAADPPGESPVAQEPSIFSGDYVTVGVGIGTLPEYEGSKENRVLPLAGAMGRIGGVGFRLRGPALSLDLYDDPPGADVTLRIGPNLRWSSNRSGHISDPVVARLGKLKDGFEAGVGVGLGFKSVLSEHDRLSIGGGVRRDISGRGGGITLSPSVSYLIPLSRAQLVGFQVSADWVDGDYARFNYGVTPAGSAASGLPVYRAKGGFKEMNLGVATVYDLNGNLLDGGFMVGAGVMYTRLHGSAARTPITALRGSRGQWLAGAGMGYTF